MGQEQGGGDSVSLVYLFMVASMWFGGKSLPAAKGAVRSAGRPSLSHW